LDDISQIGSVEDIVAENEADVVLPDEFFADDEGLCEAIGARLNGVGEIDTELRAVAKQAEEGRLVSSGVVMMRMSRIPASMRTLTG